MTKVFIDTDIIIDFTKRKGEVLKNLLAQQKLSKIQLITNPVVISEFFTDKRLVESQKLEKAKLLFRFFTPVEITAKIGYIAGDLLREREIDFLGDALIAATCLVRNVPLVTRNKKHFTKVKQLQFYRE